ncbi:MAG: hypothetical protein ACRDLV_06180 [Solirubrobacteraceae bacterium]
MTLVRVKSVVQNVVEKADGTLAPFIGLEHLQSGTAKLTVDELPLKAAEDSLRHRPGDVLFSKLRPYLAKSFLPKKPGTATGELLVLRPTVTVIPDYLLYTTLSSPWVEWANTSAYGTKMPRTSWELVGDYRMWLPSLGEQRRIADFLDAETARIDRTEELLRELIGKLVERENAIRDELFDKISAEHGELPFRRFITRIEQGQSPQCDATTRQSPDEWAVLKLSSVKRGNFDPNEHKRLPEHVSRKGMLEVARGDFLVTRANTPNLVGDVAVVRESADRLLLPDLIYRVSLTEEASPDFLAQVALSRRVRSYVESVARGSSQSMVKLRGEDIKSWPVPNATSSQQSAAIRTIEQSKLISTRLRQLMLRQGELLAERRQALITAAVTGQFDVSAADGHSLNSGVSV